jgi:hypothetical protein
MKMPSSLPAGSSRTIFFLIPNQYPFLPYQSHTFSYNSKISLQGVSLNAFMSKPVINFIKRILEITGIIFFSLVCLGIIISSFYEAEIKRLMLDELNKNVNTVINMEQFNFSLLRHFPYASVDMKQVMAKEVTDKEEKDTLLFAEHVSLMFNLTTIFDNDLAIRKIVMKDGKVKIRIDKTGKNNYHFWKPSADTTSSVVDLKKIVLDNVLISYLDKHAAQDYLFTAKDATLSGKFSGDTFTLKTKADFLVSHFLVGNVNYASEKKIQVSSDLNVNSKTDEYTFNNSHVRMNDLAFDVKGNVTSLPKTTRLDLAIDAHESKVESFMNALPAEYRKSFENNFTTKGKVSFTINIQGDEDARHVPAVSIHFSIKDGKISPKTNNVSLEKLVATGTFHNRSSGKTDVLEIPALTAILGGRKINAGIKIEDFNNPFLTLHAVTDLDLGRLNHFMKLDTLESLSGDLGLNISFAGKIKDLPRYNSQALYKVKASGDIVLKDVEFRLKRNPLEFKNINGNLSLHDNNVNVSSLKGNVSSSDFQLTGVFRNFLTYLMIPGQQADVDAKLTSSVINLDELLTNKSATAENDTSYKLKFNPRLVCRLNVEIGKLHFRKFAATQMKGAIRLSNQVITGTDLSFTSMSGMVYMDASINAARKDSVIISCSANCSKLDITQMFYEMENFDQSTITDKNVKGKISAGIQFKSSWTTDLTINSKSVVSTSDITIDNGELNDFRPILALSKYLKLADLKHIKFSTLKNQIRISNRKIYIPDMEIKSSVLNLSASGIHDFDNMVDYKLQLLLSDVLGKKVKDQNTEFGQVEDDGLGKTKLFLSMKGIVDDPKFSYDKKGVAEKIKTDIKSEKQNLKNLLTAEFGSKKKNPPAPATQKKKKEEMQVEWDDK